MQRGSTRLGPDGRSVLIPLRGRSPALVMLALFVALFMTSSLSEPSDALSEAIATCAAPTLLQQLLSFAALRDVAEEQQLDWGAPSVLGREKTYTLRVRLRGGGEDGGGEERERDAGNGEGEDDGHDVNSAAASSESRRRPHRRNRRKKRAGSHGGDNDDDDNGDAAHAALHGATSTSSTRSNRGSGGVSSCSGSVEDSHYAREHSEASFTASQRVWAQLHMMDAVFSTCDNSLLHVTERFLKYDNMFPIIYRCNLAHLNARNEQVLVEAPNTGLQTSRFWSCRSCGKAHDVVRESCVRCHRHSGPYAKLLFDQILPETDHARSVLRLLRATHPGVIVHRVETHPHVDGSGHCSVSVYVGTDAASELVTKLNGNVFFDKEDADDGSTRGGGVILHYVYSSQRPWLDAFINRRRTTYKEPDALPLSALVVVEVVEDPKRNTRAAASMDGFVPVREKAIRKQNLVFQ